MIAVMMQYVITSYSIHYTKLYEALNCSLGETTPNKSNFTPASATICFIRFVSDWFATIMHLARLLFFSLKVWSEVVASKMRSEGRMDKAHNDPSKISIRENRHVSLKKE